MALKLGQSLISSTTHVDWWSPEFKHDAGQHAQTLKECQRKMFNKLPCLGQFKNVIL
jgi:hypothetical protein